MAADNNDPASRLFVVGITQRTASALLAERLFAEEIQPSALLARLRAASVAEVMMVSTCERLELFGDADDPAAGARELLDLLAGEIGIDSAELVPQTTRRLGVEAVRHVFAVTASLDSQTVGEPQILGQIKEAHRHAVEAGAAGPALDSLLQAAYGVAKRVRNETSLAQQPVSIAASALSIARDVHGDLTRRAALLVGLGEMGEFMAAELLEAGVGNVSVVHPSLRRAEAAARRLGCHFRPWEELDDALAAADVVVAAMGVGRYAISADLAETALKRRRREPIFFVDTAVPSDIEPDAGELDGAFVYDLGDLERVALEGRATREAETEAAWRVIEEELEAFLRQHAERAAAPSVAALRQHFESARAEVLAAGQLSAEDATRLLINRLLHDPSEALRAAAAAEGDMGSTDRAELEAAVRKLFRIGDEPGNGAGESADQEDET